MMNNIKITAWLLSPLSGNPPAIDAILEYELAYKMGMKHARKLTRDIPLSEIEKPPIPLSKKTIDGMDVYRSSNPILGSLKTEWVENWGKRFESSLLAGIVHDSQMKQVMTASGPFKNRFQPLQIKLVDRICWFVRGDKKQIHKLLKNIPALGCHRNIGYGRIYKWEYEIIENDFSIIGTDGKRKVLMKTIPYSDKFLAGVDGFYRSYGGMCPPYWHPENYGEIAIPC